MASRKIFLKTGQRFGRLIVLKETDPYICVKLGTKCRQYKCKCICGNTVNVRLYALMTGKTKSCGCLRKEYKGKKHVNKTVKEKVKETCH